MSIDPFAPYPARLRERTDHRSSIVAHVHGYPPVHNAGAEMMLHAILADLASTGWLVRVVVGQRGYARTGLFDGVEVHADAEQVTVDRCYRDADVVVTHLNNTTKVAALARRYRRPLVTVLHNDFTPLDQTPGELVVFNSCWMADRLTSAARRARRSLVVRPPVDPARYRVERTERRVSLLNLYAPKGAGLFWALARRMPDVGFLAVRGAYGTQVISADLPPNVEIVDNTPDVTDVYARTGVLLMPSSYESWGRCAVEACCSGIPVVASPTPGLKEALGPAGTFLDPRDITGWERAVRDLLYNDALYRRQSRTASARAAHLDRLCRADLVALRTSLLNLAQHRQAAP